MRATIDQDTYTITFERRLPASREDAFDAWTRPEEIAEWWDPSGARLSACEIDLRPGGAFELTNQGHGPPFTGTYKVIERPSRLVFDALGTEGTVTFESTPEGTHMRVTIRCPSKAHLDHFVSIGVASNTDRTLDNLVGFVGARRRALT